MCGVMDCRLHIRARFQPNGPLVIFAITKGLSLVSKESCFWVPDYVVRSNLSGQTGLGKASDIGDHLLLLSGNVYYMASSLGLGPALFTSSLPVCHDAGAILMGELLLNITFRP